MEKLYALVLGQCTALKARIEAHPEFLVVSDTLNGVTLLSIIKGICFNFQDQKYVTSRFYSIKQHKHETVTHL